jgi:hypothetical protein
VPDATSESVDPSLLAEFNLMLKAAAEAAAEHLRGENERLRHHEITETRFQDSADVYYDRIMATIDASPTMRPASMAGRLPGIPEFQVVYEEVPRAAKAAAPAQPELVKVVRMRSVFGADGSMTLLEFEERVPRDEAERILAEAQPGSAPAIETIALPGGGEMIRPTGEWFTPAPGYTRQASDQTKR